MTDLTEFLLARIAEDEAVAAEAQQDAAREAVTLRPIEGAVTAGALSVMENIARWHPARVLAECAAKRAIVTEAAPSIADLQRLSDTEFGRSSDWDESERLLRLLSLPYAAHPDYRPEWRP